MNLALYRRNHQLVGMLEVLLREPRGFERPVQAWPARHASARYQTVAILTDRRPPTHDAEFIRLSGVTTAD
jgi:hypothetical protein